MARTFLQPSAPEARPPCGAHCALERRSCASDGNCAFHAIAEGLAWLSAGKGDNKKEFSHVELRARAAVHLQKHRTEYESEWDGIMPDGGTGKTFDDYLEAIRQLGQFASELEVRALARIYNTRVLIVPASDAFVPMVFHTSQTKRMLVLCLENKHLEFLILKVPRQGQVAKRRRQAVHPAPLPPTPFGPGRPTRLHRKCLQAPSTPRRTRVPLVHPVLGNTVHVRIPLLSPSRREPNAPGTGRRSQVTGPNEACMCASCALFAGRSTANSTCLPLGTDTAPSIIMERASRALPAARNPM